MSPWAFRIGGQRSRIKMPACLASDENNRKMWGGRREEGFG